MRIGISIARNPLRRSARAGLLHHLVNLFEGKTLRLWDEEVGVHEGAGAEAAPDEEDGGAQVGLVGVDHVGGDDGDDLVVELAGEGRMLNVENVRYSRASWRLWIDRHRGSGWGEGRSRQSGSVVWRSAVAFQSEWNMKLTQAPGPQVEAKKKIKIAMKEICAFTAPVLFAREFFGSAGSGWVWLKPTVIPMMATRN